MELLGHVSAAMSLRYDKLFNSTARADYERALAQAKAHIGQPLGQTAPPPIAQITDTSDWKQASLIKARLACCYCLRNAAQGACPYDNVCEHCPNFRTDIALLPALSAQRQDTELLANDAEQRGWNDEAARHRRLIARLDKLIDHAQANMSEDPARQLKAVRSACTGLLRAGERVTFPKVAQRAGISRATLYRQRQLRELIEQHRHPTGETLTLTTRRPSRPAPANAPSARRQGPPPRRTTPRARPGLMSSGSPSLRSAG